MGLVPVVSVRAVSIAAVGVAAVSVVVGLLAFSSCGKTSDDQPKTTTTTQGSTGTGTGTDTTELGNMPVGSLAITCGGKTCIGTEGN